MGYKKIIAPISSFLDASRKKIPFLWLVLLQNTDVTEIFNGKKNKYYKKKKFQLKKRKTH